MYPSNMEIGIEQQPGQTPVTVLRVAGSLDGGTYNQLIDTAETVYQAGERNIVVDLQDVSTLSSAGLVALHHIATLLDDKTPPDREAGWEAYHAIARQRDEPLHRRLKLRFPQPAIHDLLQSSGLNEFVEIESAHN